MNSLDEQLNAVMAILRARGHKVGIEPNAPEYVKRAFLEMILGCRDCREELRGNGDGRTN